ncbi:MAG: MFS transporter [Armatimonadota bacterium]
MSIDIDTAAKNPEQLNAKLIERNSWFLALAMFCLAFGFGAFSATYNNFAVQVLNLSPLQLGKVESIREIPGLVIVFIAALTMRVAEPIIATIALLLVAIGLGAYYTVDSFPPLILFSLIWSIGLHAWMTIQPSIAMALADKNNKGKQLGLFSSVAAIGTLCGMGLVLTIGALLGFQTIFIISGIGVAIGAVSASMISRNIGHGEKPRMVFKSRYKLYYMLTFLEGCRKQVFMTFAIYALIRNFGTSMQVVALLMIINNLANIALAPVVGWLIDRIGERKVLAFCYTALIGVFIGYAMIKNVHILYVLYCLDSLFFLGSIGLTTYIQKIAEPRDLMPTLAMGVSMNHGAAVTVPLIGAMLWDKLGYSATFFGGAVIVAISVMVALNMKTFEQKAAALEPAPAE